MTSVKYHYFPTFSTCSTNTGRTHEFGGKCVYAGYSMFYSASNLKISTWTKMHFEIDLLLQLMGLRLMRAAAILLASSSNIGTSKGCSICNCEIARQPCPDFTLYFVLWGNYFCCSVISKCTWSRQAGHRTKNTRSGVCCILLIVLVDSFNSLIKVVIL